MATTNVDLLSVISGTQVTADDVLQAELLLSQTLAAQDPTLDLRSGTAIRDLAIRPNATLLASINKALVYYWTQNSLANVDDTTPTVFVDKTLSNFFMTRFQGVNATINVKLYFAKQVNVTLTTDLYFSPDNTLMYYPATTATYSSLTYDASVNQWYLSVDLVAGAVGTHYNISSGSLIYFSNFNPYFLHAEINYLSTLAIGAETNTQFIARAKSSISTRNLINTPSINGNLLPAFPIINQLSAVGMGDINMVRDMVLASPPTLAGSIWVHVGGRTDIYCDVPLTYSLLQFTTGVAGTLQLTGSIYNTSVSNVPGGPNTDKITTAVPYTVLNDNALNMVMTSLTAGISGVDTIATVTTTLPHGLTTVDRFTISGATPTTYNGTFLVASIINETTFTYVIPNINFTTTASGTLSLRLVNRAGEVGFSSRQSMTLDFSGAKQNITNLTSITTGPVSSVYSTIVTVTAAAHGYPNGYNITMLGLSSGNGLYTISSVTADTFQYTFTGATAPGVITFSGATVQAIHANESVSLNTYYHQDLDGIQTYLADPVNRTLSSDQLARGYNLTSLTVSITGYGSTAPNQNLATTTVNSYLKQLAPGQPFIMADLLSKLYAVGITTIKTPLNITYTKYWKDLLGSTTGTITDVMDPKDTLNIFVLNTLTSSVTVI